MAYSTDADLVKVQNNILSLGFASWPDQHIEADAIIDRAVESGWFRGVADEIGHTDDFNAALLLVPSQLLRSSVYKTLELIYLFLISNNADDDIKEKYELFKGLYQTELETTFVTGLSYDWDGSGSIEQDETNITKTPRILTR